MSKQIRERKARTLRASEIYEEEVSKYNALRNENPHLWISNAKQEALIRIMSELSVSRRTAVEYLEVATAIHRSNQT